MGQAEPHQEDNLERVVNLRVTHKRAPLSLLEAAAFRSLQSAARKILSLRHIEECDVLQTCNRVEIYAVASGDGAAAEAELERFWRQRWRARAVGAVLEKSRGTKAILHLLRVASGLESMVVGEDEVLGQVKRAYEEGKRSGFVGPVLDRLFQAALKVGKAVRSETEIDRGAVSMGSAGVELLQKSLGSLEMRKVLVVGAGEAGEMVGRALASRKAGVVFVANRTYQRAVVLAKALGGRALPLDALERYLSKVDAVVVATSAPHYLLSYEPMARVVAKRGARPLVVVDLSEPRNVDRAVVGLSGVRLRDIEDLRRVVRLGIERRSKEVRKAEGIVERGLGQLLVTLKRDRVEPLVSVLFRHAEEIRRKEVTKALARLDGKNNGTSQAYSDIVEDLSKSLVGRLLSDPVAYLRQSAVDGDLERVSEAQRLFKLESDD